MYGDYSRRAREIVERFSPVVIAASIDEHYIDFRGCERLYRRREDADSGLVESRGERTMGQRRDGDRGHVVSTTRLRGSEVEGDAFLSSDFEGRQEVSDPHQGARYGIAIIARN